MIQNLSEEEVVRRSALNKLREKGIDPFPAAEFKVNTTAKEIKENYEEGKTVIVKNESIKDALMKDSFFERILKRFKKGLAKDSTLYELLKEFEKKYVTSEMRADFDIILSKVKKK
jgi:lysyl-tRNA synthetase class II